MEPGLAVTAYYAAPNLLPARRDDDRVASAAHGFVADVAVVEVDRETGEVDVLDYVTVHDAGRLLNPLLAEGQVRGGLAHGAAAALFERHVCDEDGNLLTGSFLDYLTPTAPDLPTPRIGHRESPSPFLPLGAKGPRRGDDDERARCDRERRRGRPRARRRRAAVHTRSRLGAAAAMKPAPFDYVRPEVARRGARGARRARRREGARRRTEPRAGAEHAPAAPDAARGRQPRSRARRRR